MIINHITNSNNNNNNNNNNVETLELSRDTGLAQAVDVMLLRVRASPACVSIEF